MFFRQGADLPSVVGGGEGFDFLNIKSELQYFSETLQNRADVFRIDPTIFKSSS